jgi:hypothetical protein
MSDMCITEEGNMSRNAVLELLIGDQLGSGAYRRVYELKRDDTLVAKIEYYGKEFCNIVEMGVWREVRETPIEKWFAPCEAIDSLGLVLFQRRTQPFASRQAFDAEVLRQSTTLPDFFDDVHWGNFGMLEGRLVCHDYGFNHFIKQGVTAGWKKLAHEDGQYELGL